MKKWTWFFYYLVCLLRDVSVGSYLFLFHQGQEFHFTHISHTCGTYQHFQVVSLHYLGHFRDFSFLLERYSEVTFMSMSFESVIAKSNLLEELYTCSFFSREGKQKGKVHRWSSNLLVTSHNQHWLERFGPQTNQLANVGT